MGAAAELREQPPMWSWASMRVLAERVVREAVDDRVVGLAAEVAFFTLISLPPMLIALLAAAGFVGDALGPDVTERAILQIVDAASALFSERTVQDRIEPELRQLLTQGRADVASLGIVIALWSASRSAHVLIDALTVAYDLERRRPLWRRRALAVLFTLAGLVIVGGVLPIMVAGPKLGAALVEPLGLAESFATVWRVLYYPIVGIVSIAVLAAIYHFAAPWKTPYRRDIPGAVLALVIWIVASLGLRAYAGWALQSSSFYGSLAVPFVLMLWVYFTAFAVLMGAELNAEVERMWPTITEESKQEAVEAERAEWSDEGEALEEDEGRADEAQDDEDERPSPELDGDGMEIASPSARGTDEPAATQEDCEEAERA